MFKKNVKGMQQNIKWEFWLRFSRLVVTLDLNSRPQIHQKSNPEPAATSSSILPGRNSSQQKYLGNSCSYLPTGKLFRKFKCKNIEQLDLPGRNIVSEHRILLAIEAQHNTHFHSLRK